MRLTTFSDLALRVLMFAGAKDRRLATIEETSRTYNVSKAHLMKVVNALTKAGFLQSVRGRSGGFRLAKRPSDIRLGAVVQATEPDFSLVECFATGNQCILTNNCRLPNVLNEALTSFIETLDRYTLADILLSEDDFGYAGASWDKLRGPSISNRAS